MSSDSKSRALFTTILDFLFPKTAFQIFEEDFHRFPSFLFSPLPLTDLNRPWFVAPFLLAAFFYHLSHDFSSVGERLQMSSAWMGFSTSIVPFLGSLIARGSPSDVQWTLRLP